MQRVEVTPEVAEAELLSQAKVHLGPVRRALAQGGEIGIWFGRSKTRAVVSIARGVRHAVVEPIALVPGPDGTAPHSRPRRFRRRSPAPS